VLILPRAMKLLVTTGRQRDRVYACGAYLEVLAEDTGESD
jgi:hypothetical protein